MGNTSIGGTVTDALTSVPLPGARVVALGDRVGVMQRQRVVAETRTENSGEFILCGLDANTALSITATFGNNATLPVEIVRAGPHVMDMTIHISDPVTINGTVMDYATRAPLVGCRGPARRHEPQRDHQFGRQVRIRRHPPRQADHPDGQPGLRHPHRLPDRLQQRGARP